MRTALASSYNMSLILSSSPHFTLLCRHCRHRFQAECQPWTKFPSLNSFQFAELDMAMGRQGSAAALMGCVSAFVVVMVAMAMVMASTAYGQPQQCNLKTLMPCLKAVKGPYPPQPDVTCCEVVMDYNPSCMCSEFVDSKDYPQSYIKNVLAIPKACGRYQLSGSHCGKYTIE